MQETFYWVDLSTESAPCCSRHHVRYNPNKISVAGGLRSIRSRRSGDHCSGKTSDLDLLIAMFDKFIDLYIKRTAIKIRRNGEILIVMSDRGEVRYLNETAAYLYEHFDGSLTLREVFDLLLTEYDIDQQDITSVEQDVVNVIRDLQWQGLIELRRTKAA